MASCCSPSMATNTSCARFSASLEGSAPHSLLRSWRSWLKSEKLDSATRNRQWPLFDSWPLLMFMERRLHASAFRYDDSLHVSRENAIYKQDRDICHRKSSYNPETA